MHQTKFTLDEFALEIWLDLKKYLFGMILWCRTKHDYEVKIFPCKRIMILEFFSSQDQF